MASKTKPTGKHILKIPNTPEGQKFFEQFQRYLNRRYHIRRRGRASRKTHPDQLRIPISESKYFVVYITEIMEMQNDIERMHESIILGTQALEEWEYDNARLEKELEKYQNVWWRRVARWFITIYEWPRTHNISLTITKVKKEEK